MSGVALQVEGGVATLTLQNEAKYNALDVQMLEDLEKHVEEIEGDPEVRILILTGAGQKAFCSGADIAAWGSLTPAEFSRHWVRGGHRLFDRIARLSKPSIAALNGHAFGGGLELATACDLRIASPKALLALPEARVGIVPGWSGTQRLVRLMGECLVKEMALFGRRIEASRAMQAGYVSEIAEDPLLAAQTLAQAHMALSPRATEIAKAMILAGSGEDSAAMIDALGSAAIAASDDREEGVAAFMDKRDAQFTGK
ncbi:enoyl-CoA hydratase/isomerase family protein [Shimia sp. R10_1]|uniref:enoyl-CoA hydratase/isomerase family protein n=1 Tax=Shimia sp. R10_1 TaxID=2821095 RepID=UPI001ADA1838|nr:enoyl-CoA hydratase/isomerase family protein [Shimia sp. R10_1]